MSDYDISVSTNGPEGVEIATSIRKPDLILLDIMMPGMDGYEVCRILKAGAETKHIPIIFITAINEEEEEAKGFRLGAVDYITKPFSPGIVRARVRTHLDLKLYRDHLEDLVRERTEDLRKSHEQLERRVEERTAELSRSNALLKQEIIERKRSEAALKENEEYLQTIMSTIQTGVLIIDPRTRRIIDANPWVGKMVGYSENELVGSECSDIEDENFNNTYLMPLFCRSVKGGDCILETKNKEIIQVRRSFAKAVIRDNEYYIYSLLDITDIKDLMNKQEMNIDLAKNLLGLVNQPPPRYVPLPRNLALFVNSVSTPCYAEGGDHLFVRTVAGDPSAKTVFSLKDQSGHEVSCVLRSIITDLLHNSMLNRPEFDSIEYVISALNDTICRLGAFRRDDFFTSITAEINHETLEMKFISAGHPPFLLIRGNEVFEMPETGASGSNVPVAFVPGIEFTYGETALKIGDKLLFYTDGLTEMPLKNKNEIITTHQLISLVKDIIKDRNEIPVTDIMDGVLNQAAALSGEQVVSGKEENGPINTSGDDVTLLCFEIENNNGYSERTIKAENATDISDFIDETYKLLAEIWNVNGFENPDARLRMVIEEGVLNAWIHGNQQNPEKTITVRWRIGNDFNLEIIDQGPGFDSCRIPDPTLDNNIEKPCGRGIFIIKHFADSAAWNDCGRHLRTWFRKNPLPEDQRETNNPITLW